MFNYFKCTTSSSQVLGTVTPEQYLQTIQKGDENLETIQRAREIYQSNRHEYDLIKTKQLPCYTLNFTFNKKRSNSTILDSTGYMYLDVDGTTEIDFSNPLVYATWLSLSATGRGLLVKVEGLTLENIKYVYEDVAKKLEISADDGAKKATQVNVLSYDPDLYSNPNSYTYQASEKISHFSTINLKKDTNGTELGENLYGLRFDNLNELIENVEFHDSVIYEFEEKVKYADVYLPNEIQDGSRNHILCNYCYQLRALNPHIDRNTLEKLLSWGNTKYCKPPYSNSRIREIVDGVMSVKNPKPIPNKSRRFLYDPDAKLSTKEKRALAARRISEKRKESNIRIIEDAIREWEFVTMGKITRKAISEVTGIGKNTVGRHCRQFKSQIQFLNQEYGKSIK